MKSLSALAPDYDAILSDVWGVLHNSVVPHPEACDALVRYRAGGGRVVLITNAPLTSPPIIKRLDEIGVPREAYDAIVSSGDVTRHLLEEYRGQTIHYVGPPGAHDSLFEGLDLTLGTAEEASVVVVTDPEFEADTPDMYRDRMKLWLSRNLPLIAANPDHVVEHGDRIVYRGGAIADIYATSGGRVAMAGKPHPPIYAEALRLAEQAAGRSLDKSRVLAIGDAVRTDALGAANFGIDFMFITGSIHAEELDAFDTPDPAAVHDLVAPTGAVLAGFQPRLAW